MDSLFVIYTKLNRKFQYFGAQIELTSFFLI